MSQFWNNWATAHRMWKAIFTAIFLFGILILALVLREQESSRQLLKTEIVISTITDMKKHTSTHSTRYGGTVHEIYKYWIMLPSGEEIEIITSIAPASPKVNSQVPIIVYHYDDGQKRYGIDRIDWLLYN